MVGVKGAWGAIWVLCCTVLCQSHGGYRVQQDLPDDCLIYCLAFVSNHADSCRISSLDTNESPHTRGTLANRACLVEGHRARGWTAQKL